MSIEELTRPKRIDEERIQKLKELFPEAFADGKLNLEILQEEINGFDEELIESNTEEFYGLQWVGKKEARRLAFLPPQGTLKFVEGEGINEEITKNIFIEGDNLEVLRLLQKSYAGRIKMIYIDPPYNTGNDFIYKDDFKEPINKYLQRTGQADEEGLLTSNPKSGGRYHANWLNMMYPRLKLARNLLKKDGVIFVSIDDHEQANLKIMMDEIFGEENFIACISVINNLKGRSDEKYIATAHEYLMIYQRGEFETYGVPIPKEYIKEYDQEDEFGPYRLQGLRKRGSGAKREDRPHMYYPFYYDPKNNTLSLERVSDNCIEIYPKLSDGTDGRWRWGKDTAQKNLHLLTVKFINTRQEFDIYQKDYLYQDGVEKTVKPKSFWNGSEFSSDSGTLAFKQLFKSNIFQNPKPIGLIKYCLTQATRNEDIVLDFFAGSGTTAQAVLEMNKEDGGRRSFILVQIPERIEVSGYETIADITKERIRRSISLINEEGAGDKKFDTGFKVFKLDKSNLRKWNNFNGESVEQLEANLDYYTSAHFIEGCSSKDIIIELMLHHGFPLDSVISQNPKLGNNTLWTIEHSDVPFKMYVCLDETLDESTVSYLSGKSSMDMFICLDDALTDESKVILSETLKVKTI
jgi:adenine-specific DNA-methyltransferase